MYFHTLYNSRVLVLTEKCAVKKKKRINISKIFKHCKVLAHRVVSDHLCSLECLLWRPAWTETRCWCTDPTHRCRWTETHSCCRRTTSGTGPGWLPPVRNNRNHICEHLLHLPPRGTHNTSAGSLYKDKTEGQKGFYRSQCNSDRDWTTDYKDPILPSSADGNDELKLKSQVCGLKLESLVY